MISLKTVRFLKFMSAFGVVPVLLFAYQFGPDPANTGAPGDNPTACVNSGCHAGTVNSAANGGSVTIQMPNGATTYTPGGAKQLITVLIKDANRKSWGFQMTARLASNLKSGQAGHFTDLNGSTTGAQNSAVQVLCANFNNSPCPASNPVEWAEHSLAGWSASVNHPGTYSYQMYWTPPTTNVGNVTIYAAGNASNSATTSAPDQNSGHIYTSNIILTPGTVSTPGPAISSGGVVSAGNFGAFTSAGPGSWIEIYGTNVAPDSRGWAGTDFAGSAAPTTLDNVTVTVGGQSAYVSYISPGQIDAQIPANVGTGAQPIVVTTSAGSSAPYSITINSIQPGLLAPPSFTVGGKQYAAAFHADLTTFVMPPGAIAGVPSAYAKPGETIIIYGVGFGAVSPASVQFAGQIVSATSSLSNFSMSFGGSAGVPTYAGLAPGFVGLYQINITVPQIANSDLVPLTFKVGATSGTQTLYTAVHN